MPPEPTRDEIVDTLADVVNQACAIGGTVDSLALWSYADAIRLLARLGHLEIIEDNGGRMLKAHWADADRGKS